MRLESEMHILEQKFSELEQKYERDIGDKEENIVTFHKQLEHKNHEIQELKQIIQSKNDEIAEISERKNEYNDQYELKI